MLTEENVLITLEKPVEFKQNKLDCQQQIIETLPFSEQKFVIPYNSAGSDASLLTDYS